MSLDLFGKETNPVKLALARLHEFQPPDGYYLAFSGGKDSVALLQLARDAGVRFDAHFHRTTLDPPELLRFIHTHFPDVSIHTPKESFFSLISHRGAPNRRSRWCCNELKEQGGHGRTVLTGIRWAESVRRKQRSMVEHCYRDPSKNYVHPMIDWSTPDVWAYTQDNHLPTCSLYEEGFKRIGCIACTMQSSKTRWQDLKRWPRFERAFVLAFEKLYALRKAQGRTSVDRWPNASTMFHWWMSDSAAPDPDQVILFDD